MDIQSQFEKISLQKNHPYVQGLALKYLGNEKQAFSKFNEGKDLQHAHSTYELAKIMDRRGDHGVFDIYKKATDLGHTMAILGQGNYEENDYNRFSCFKTAGEYGVGEGYYLVGKMIEEGFVITEDKKPKIEKDWFVMAAQIGSLNALLKLAQDSEDEGNDEEAFKYYKILSKIGNLKGYLEEGRLLVNHGLYEEAKKIYKKASWMGLYEVANLDTLSTAASVKEAADQLFKSHFEKLIRIAEKMEEIDD